MTNKEFLNAKTSPDLVAWLDSEQADFTPAITVVGGDWELTPNFKPEEFVCKCGKCSFSKPEGVQGMDYNLRAILQAIRNKYGLVSITCGARCKEYNDSLSGSVSNSKHMQLKAADFHISNVTNTEKGREDVLAYAKKLVGYNYGYHNKGGKYPNMGSAIHIDVK